MNFLYIECGLCCRLSGNIPQLQHLQNEKGLCRYFNEATNRCRIYQTRPTICNTEKMYTLYFKEIMSKDEYIYKNLQICYDLNKAASNIGNMQKIEKLMKQLDM